MDPNSELYQMFMKVRGKKPLGDGGDDKDNRPTPPLKPTLVVAEKTVECSICLDEVAISEAVIPPCCGGVFCQDCYTQQIRQSNNPICPSHGCGAVIPDDTPLLNLDQALRFKLRKANLRQQHGGWINCPNGSCNGGAPGIAAKDTYVTCLACNTLYCSYCAEQKGGIHVHKGQSCNEYAADDSLKTIQQPNNMVEVEPDDEVAWSGAVRCPTCGEPVQRDGGCSALTCPQCIKDGRFVKAQFQADGKKGGQHTENTAGFDKALSQMSKSMSELQLDAFLNEFADWAAVFRLHALVKRVRVAAFGSNFAEVEHLLSLLSRNPAFAGLVHCLHALYMPPQ